MEARSLRFQTLQWHNQFLNSFNYEKQRFGVSPFLERDSQCLSLPQCL